MLNWWLISGGGGLTGYLGSLKISSREERRLKDTQNLKCEDRRFQNCLVLKTENFATKPTKPEDWRFEFSTGKIWLLSVFNWEDSSWWYLPQTSYQVPISVLEPSGRLQSLLMWRKEYHGITRCRITGPIWSHVLSLWGEIPSKQHKQQ